MERVSVSQSSMRSRYSRVPETVANQDGIFEPTTWRESDHNAVQRSRVRCTGTPWLRDKEDTLPHRISTVWNVATPLRSAIRLDRPCDCVQTRQSVIRKDDPIPQREEDDPRSECRLLKGTGKS